ncbi:MAG: hypothetical protein U5L00_03075 [Desulfovermiculus sp.]|nr:hypothetical protein [Desulfovermiculus sp.]
MVTVQRPFWRPVIRYLLFVRTRQFDPVYTGEWVGAKNLSPSFQSRLCPQPKEERIEPQRHEGPKGTELDILQNRVTVLEKAAFSFAAARQMKNTLLSAFSLVIFVPLWFKHFLFFLTDFHG